MDEVEVSVPEETQWTGGRRWWSWGTTQEARVDVTCHQSPCPLRIPTSDGDGCWSTRRMEETWSQKGRDYTCTLISEGVSRQYPHSRRCASCRVPVRRVLPPYLLFVVFGPDPPPPRGSPPSRLGTLDTFLQCSVEILQNRWVPY